MAPRTKPIDTPIRASKHTGHRHAKPLRVEKSIPAWPCRMGGTQRSTDKGHTDRNPDPFAATCRGDAVGQPAITHVAYTPHRPEQCHLQQQRPSPSPHRTCAANAAGGSRLTLTGSRIQENNPATAQPSSPTTTSSPFQSAHRTEAAIPASQANVPANSGDKQMSFLPLFRPTASEAPSSADCFSLRPLRRSLGSLSKIDSPDSAGCARAAPGAGTLDSWLFALWVASTSQGKLCVISAPQPACTLHLHRSPARPWRDACP